MSRLIHQHIVNWRSSDQQSQLKGIVLTFNELIEELNKDAGVVLTTPFIKLAYIIHQHRVPKEKAFYLHRCRTEIERYAQSPDEYKLGEELTTFTDRIFVYLLNLLDGNDSDITDVPSEFTRSTFRDSEERFLKDKRLVVLGKKEGHLFYAVSPATPEQELICQLPMQRELFGLPMVQIIEDWIGFPFVIHAFNINIHEDIFKPEYMVIEPDFLVDVTSIAGSFQSYGRFAFSNVFYRLFPTTPSKYLIIGNMVNHFLDELVMDKSKSFSELFKSTFRLHPLALSLMTDEEIMEIYNTCQRHYNNLIKNIDEDLDRVGVEIAHCTLEPSFISNLYGIQGRLDVLHLGEGATIIELKSGKPFRPNKYGIKQDHYVQTLMYDLMVRSVGMDENPKSFILYSVLEDRGLRYAPPIKALQVEALESRNEIILLDSLMRHGSTNGLKIIIERLVIGKMDNASSFHQRDAAIFAKAYMSSSTTAQAFYLNHVAFLLREMRLSKTGDGNPLKAIGLSKAWLSSVKIKEREFDVLSNLNYDYQAIDDGYRLIFFKRTSKTPALANFRKGDVAMLYPYNAGDESVLKNQIFKCSIINIDAEKVVVRLRSRQFVEAHFLQEKLWNIERDVLDSGANSMFDSLFYFLENPLEFQNKLLGIDPPSETCLPLDGEYKFSDILLQDQKEIVQQIIKAKDYYLLWGPPGTGKTSILIRELVKYYYEATDYNIFLLGYTNRSVDEICETLVSLPGDSSEIYLRIGSRFSSGTAYAGNLLDSKLKEVESRKQLRELLGECRIFCSTIASFWGKRQVLDFNKKSILIVDEASQILEPGLIGLLGRFEKFVLVGDHKQLPAVSLQSEGVISDSPELVQAGLHHLNRSLFERLYIQALENNWHWAYGLLKHQGRMHDKIMQFVNGHFYEGKLSHVPTMSRLTAGAMPDYCIKDSRFIFIPSTGNPFSGMIKANKMEAGIVVSLLKSIAKNHGCPVSELPHGRVGIITPFRAQIAMIKSALDLEFGRNLDAITVDTVERYQGGARDIIIISLCVNIENQLQAISSMTEFGVDRKLNVAITRAKEQVIVIGDPSLIKKSEAYNSLLEYADWKEDI